MSDLAALEVKGLEKRYKDFSLRVSFDLAPGEVLGLVGPNGAGKTTIVYCLLRLVKPDGGRVRFFGLDMDRHEVEIKRRVGFFLEEAPLFRQVRVGDVLTFFASLYPRWDWSVARELSDQFDLDGSKKVSELSKGMRAKLGLVTAFSHRPELIILDEPTAGLDPGMRREFVHLVRRMRGDFSPAILLMSHIMGDVEDLADKVGFLQGGRISLIERKAVLLQKWRRIRGRCSGRLRLDLPEWLEVEYDRARSEFQGVTDRWEDILVERLQEAGLEDLQVSTMNLEEIYTYVIRTAKRQRNEMTSPEGS